MSWKRTEPNAVTLPEGLEVGDVRTFDLHVSRTIEDGRRVSTRVRSHRVKEHVESRTVVNGKGEQVQERTSTWSVADAELAGEVLTFPAVEGGWPAPGWEELTIVAVPVAGEPVTVLTATIE